METNNGEAKVAEDVVETQLQVRFSTKLEEKFRVVNTPFAVPSSLNRYGLSEIINALLALGGTFFTRWDLWKSCEFVIQAKPILCRITGIVLIRIVNQGSPFLSTFFWMGSFCELRWRHIS